MLVYGAGAAWNRLCLPGAGADPIWLESAPGPRTSQHWREVHTSMHIRVCMYTVF